MSQILLTVEEVAARLSCHPHTVRRWIWSHKLKAVKVGDMVRVAEEEVTRFLRPISGPRKKSQSVPKGPAAVLALMRDSSDKIDADDVKFVEAAIAEAEQSADWRNPFG